MPQKIHKPFRFWSILTSVFLLLIIFGYSGARNNFFKPIEYVTIPILHIGHTIGQWIQKIPGPFTEKKTLLRQNEELQQENKRLVQENSALRAIFEQDQITFKISDFLASISQRGVLAHVIGKSVSEQNILIIDKGGDSGIVKGSAVITSNGILIGTIDQVHARASYVLLVTDTSQSIAAKIQNETSSPGVISGEYNLALSMELIPQNDPVETHQSVVTSALEPLIPPNILIGSITEVSKKEGSVFQNAKVVSQIQLNRVETVSVIIPPDANF